MKNLLWELQALADSDRYPFHMPGHKRNLAGLWENAAAWGETAARPGGEAVQRPTEKTAGPAADENAGGPTSGIQLPYDVLARAARLDITEIDDFDNLHAPEGILKEMLQRAAELYGADETFYSVNGSTAGLLTAISAAVPEGGKVLVARNCHKAVYHALYLRRLRPVYLYPGVLGAVPGGGASEAENALTGIEASDDLPAVEASGALSIADALRPEAIERALNEHPDAKAVILTSPTYDGICADVAAIAETVHAHGAVLIVDGAHGAHFGFHPGFPESPVRLGADLTVVSLHKTLPAMTQTALLHVKGHRVDRERLRMFSGMYQTSSPSYFFMAGMDTCVRLIRDRGPALWEEFWCSREEFLKKTVQLRNLRVIAGGAAPTTLAASAVLLEPTAQAASVVLLEPPAQPGFAALPPGTVMDAGKILIQSGKSGLTGQQIYDILLSKYHLQLEMAAGDYATAIVTCCDSREGWDRLAAALVEIDESCGQPEAAKAPHRRRPYPPLKRGLELPEALDGAKETCPLEAAEGRIAGGFINLYPPGIPIVVPGEVLSGEVIGLIREYEQEGLPLQGVAESRISVMK